MLRPGSLPLGRDFAGTGSGFDRHYSGAGSGLLVLRVRGGAAAGRLVTAVTETSD